MRERYLHSCVCCKSLHGDTVRAALFLVLMNEPVSVRSSTNLKLQTG